MSANNKPSTVGIKSHIQMPKLLLKRFHNKHNHFCSYHVESGHIGIKGTAGSINTQLGYYSEEMEHYLRDIAETTFGQLLSDVEKVNFDTEILQSGSEFERAIIRFLNVLMARDPLLIKRIKRDSFFSQFFSSQELHDRSVRYCIDYAERRKFFSEFFVTFMVNKTNIPFVLPVCGVYEYSIRKSTVINLPVSPKLAICLIHKSYADVVIREDGMKSILLLEDTKDGVEKVQIMNDVAFSRQKRLQWGYVVCPERDELDRLANKFR